MNAASHDASAESLRIVPVETKRDMDRFIRVPWHIYADDPAWVPPLMLERREAFSPKKNPYFTHARHRYWLALRNGEPVGRISAQIDDLAQSRQGENVGHFGLIEAIDDESVFAALFETAESWLRDQGMETVLGPFNLSINQETGLLIDGFDIPPMLMMGHARPYYGDRIESLGYAKERDLYAYYIDVRPPMNKHMAQIVHRAEKNGRVKMRSIAKKDLDSELQTIRDIFNDAWAANWGFVPITREEMTHMAETMKLIIRPDMCFIADVDGEPAGFMIALPNLNEAIKDLDGRLLPFGWAKLIWRLKVRHPTTIRVPLMGIRHKYQNTALGVATALSLIENVRVNGVKCGISHAELSWILEDNQGMRAIMEMVEPNPYKTYRVYRKSLG